MQMNMEKLLAGLFAFQKFEKEPALTDDELDTLSAAGDPFSQPPDPKERDRKT